MKNRDWSRSGSVSRRSTALACGLACAIVMALCAVAVPAARASSDTAKSPQPNIVIILTDDMGYSDIGCYGGEIPTPNIDRLAAGGMRFAQFYNNAVCAPTRASLLTGMDNYRAGQGGNNVNPDDPFWKLYDWPAHHGVKIHETVTLPQLLRQAGYQTYMTGKWHQGERDGWRPTHRGFDRYFGALWGGVDSQFVPRWAEYRLDDTIFREFPKDFYTTDAFTDYAMRFIKEGDPNRPFFLYLSYTAAHTPWNAKSEDIAKVKDLYDGDWEKMRRRRFERQKELGLFDSRTQLPESDISAKQWQKIPNQNWEPNVHYAAIVNNLDQNVGRLVEFLKTRGLLENTLILYLHDNGQWALGFGGGPAWAEASNTPFRLFKGTVHEGGIRTPLIAHWPKAIPAGVIQRKQYAHVKDIAPTLLELVGLPQPTTFLGRKVLPMDGHSFLSSLYQPDHAESHPIFWESCGSEALRDGPWKLVRSAPDLKITKPAVIQIGKGTGEWELYNLDDDPTEANNLATQYPERVREMAARHRLWSAEVGVVPYEITESRRQEFIKAKGIRE